jgi:SAM-dependent methyltransferase
MAWKGMIPVNRDCGAVLIRVGAHQRETEDATTPRRDVVTRGGMTYKEHWESVYGTKGADAVSWFQPTAQRSLATIRRVVPALDAAIIDVGGGASTLVDDLLRVGYRNLTVLDLAGSALATARARLGADARRVSWLEADVRTIDLPTATYDVWHDRAVFHFLTDGPDRAVYVEQVRRSMRPGGFVLVATFAEDGPTKCSGLPVARYSADALHREFGDEFTLLTSEHESHRTPAGAIQSFNYCLCRWNGAETLAPTGLIGDRGS